ncbi:mitotic spindle assembly checkpoint protein MAD2B [Nilaparvata lugens]|uniref:mitotic spindle assembly checkpoint protein MAD2B n=1 Tax=Nilaparvata lugens TaxID=108931 RepID=UPI00193EA1CE|nr:mitotic spindle assembly checkpoint protein MAD2B [Nilaparvata lugens]XP_039277458.1 mitotic spindle assembly checkpoint protein MAD2B [Nilaparvata lugens]
MKSLMQMNKLGQVSVVILNRDSVPIEKFVFRFQSRKDLYNPRSDAAMNKAYSVLRSLIMRMSSTIASLKKLPENSSFMIEVHTTESAMIEVQQAKVQQDFPWIEAESKEVVLSNPTILPIKNINETGVMQMEVFIEENI